MILLRRILPILSPILVAIFLILLTYRVDLWYWWVGIIVAIVVLTHAYLLEWKVLTSEFWWSMVPLTLWITGGIGFFLFVVSPLYQWMLIAVLSVVYGVYAENVFTYHFQPQKYAHMSLPRLSYYMLIIASFFFYSFLFALDVINSIPWWSVLIVAPISTAFIIAVMFRGYAVLERKNLIFIFFGAFVVLEIVWVIQFLPTSYIVNGTLIALLTYILPPLLSMVARDAVDRSTAIQYGVVAFLTAAIVLGTAQWI